MRVQPDFGAATQRTLARHAAVIVIGQKGLWYQVRWPDQQAGYVRVNEARLSAAARGDGTDNLQALVTRRSGHGHVTEMAGVRGLNESELRATSFNGDALARMEANRVTAAAAQAWAAQHGWRPRQIAWAGGAPPHEHKVEKGLRQVALAGARLAPRLRP